MSPQNNSFVFDVKKWMSSCTLRGNPGKTKFIPFVTKMKEKSCSP